MPLQFVMVGKVVQLHGPVAKKTAIVKHFDESEDERLLEVEYFTASIQLEIDRIYNFFGGCALQDEAYPKVCDQNSGLILVLRIEAIEDILT